MNNADKFIEVFGHDNNVSAPYWWWEQGYKERSTAYWIKQIIGNYRCSNCCWLEPASRNYCSNCGAKMEYIKD